MNKSEGQTLIEAVMMIAILIIVVIGLIATITASLYNVSFSRNQILATKYAQETLERIRAYRDKEKWTTFIANCQNPPDLSPLPSPFVRTITCTTNEEIGDEGRKVEVVISWTDSRGTHKSNLTTYLTKWK